MMDLKNHTERLYSSLKKSSLIVRIVQKKKDLQCVLYIYMFLFLDDSKTVDEKLKLQQQESTRRENVLVMRLATKEQEMQELLVKLVYTIFTVM